jgi:hypothetical protein
VACLPVVALSLGIVARMKQRLARLGELLSESLVAGALAPLLRAASTGTCIRIYVQNHVRT